ncbi:Tubulointerstitial nephritis antigen-like [Branchiostoma belcheri]|nr:Tubulointerstitial nephritis antigen-like [Branchiostoma belcheri]
MSRRRGRRRHRRSRARSRAVTFPRCPPSDTHADQKSGRLRFLKAAAITVLILVAVTSIAGVVMTAQSLSNTGEDKPTINLPPYGSKGDDQAGSGDSEGLSPYVYSGWTGVRVKPRDFVENDAKIHNGPDGMASTDAPLIPDAMVPVGMTPPTGHTENARVPDNQMETFRSEGWKRFRVEQNYTEGVNSTTEAPTAPPHVVGDEEGEEVTHDWGYTTGENHCNNRFRVEQNHTDGANSTTEAPTVPPHVVGDEEGEEVGHDWGYTTGENHCNNVRVRRRVSKVPVGMTPPADHTENARVPDNQTETFRSEGWKRFRVEQNHTEGANSTTEAPTVSPHVVGDEEAEVTHDWGYTTGENHCNNVRVRRRVSKVPFPATDDSSATRATHLEPKPNSSLDKKVSGDVDSMGTDRTGAMDNVFTKNSTDLNLYLDAVLTDIMKSHKRKHCSGLERIKRSKAIVVLAAVGVLIAGSVAHVYLRQIVP